MHPLVDLHYSVLCLGDIVASLPLAVVEELSNPDPPVNFFTRLQNHLQRGD